MLVPPIDTRLKELLLEKQEGNGYRVISMEVMPDHVHLLLDVDPRVGVYPTMTKIKGYTSRMIRKEFSFMKSKLPSLWTRSKFIATSGTVSTDMVKQYIEDQKGV